MVSDWQTVKLSEVVNLIGGGTPKRNHPEFWNGPIPWLSVKDFNNDYRHIDSAEESITEFGLSESSTKILKEGQLIISARGTVGALGQLSRPMAFNQSCYGIDAKSKYATNDFLYYLVKYSINNLRQITHGAVFDTITRETFNNIHVKLPPLPEQKAIAHILGTLDDKIELNRQMNETLEAMAQAIFKSWFVDFDPVIDKALAAGNPIPPELQEKAARRKALGNRRKSLPPDIARLFPDSFEDSELGPIPKGWKIGSLGSIVTQRMERIEASKETESMPYVPVECISKRSLFLSESKPGEEAKSSLTKFYRGDILFGAMRPYFHKVCLAPFDGTTRTTAFVLKPIRDNDFAFALMLLHQESTIEYATVNSTGSTIPYIKWEGSLDRMPFVESSSNLRSLYNNKIGDFLDAIPPKYFENLTLISLRDTLLPKLLSGELRADIAEKEMERRI